MLRSGKSEYIIIFLFSCATSITVPFKRDFVTHQLHASAFVAAMLISLNSFCTFIATPFFGSLSDKIGRKPVIIFGCIGTLCAQWMWFSKSLFWFTVSQGIAGLSFVVQMSCRAMVVDTTDSAERSGKIGVLGAVQGVAFLVSVGAGGVLYTMKGFQLPISISMTCLIACLIIVLRSKETLVKKKEGNEKMSVGFFSQFGSLWDNDSLGALLSATALIFGSGAMIPAAFLEHANGVLLMNARDRSYWLMSLGVIVFIIQSSLKYLLVLMKSIANNPGNAEKNLISVGCGLLMTSLLVGPFTNYTTIFVAGILWGGGQNLCQPLLNALVSKNVPSETQGLVIGFLESVGSIGRVIGPILMNFLFTLDYRLTFGVCIVLNSLGMYMFKQSLKSPLNL